MSSDHRTKQLLARACEIGFDPVGVCCAEPAATFPVFVDWLDETMRDDACCGMSWLMRHRDARRHPEAVLPGVKSLVVVGLSYAAVNPATMNPVGNLPKPCPDGFGLVAEYARGPDYHDVMRAKLRQLAETHHALFPDAKTRIAVDTAPILEREYAARAGLGLPGKNTMLINNRYGSRFFLGVLLSTAEMEPVASDLLSVKREERTVNHDSSLSLLPSRRQPLATSHSPCGDCRRCIDACPTGALATPWQLDARKCINYWLIEHPGGDIPREIAAKFGNRLFGCETCQSVCPYNTGAKGEGRRTREEGGGVQNQECSAPATSHQPRAAHLREQLETGVMSLSQIENLDESEFHHLFAGTPLLRLGLSRLKRNAAIVRENAGF
jgi:epoxyqueuosine reductase